MREDHCVIADLVGKGKHIRTVPVPLWAKRAVDEWIGAAAIADGPIFRRVSRLDKIWGDGITPKAIWHVVRAAAKRADIKNLAPHDLRRYAESEIMPNRDSKPPANPRESYRSSIVRPGPCGIIRCASKDMHEAQHSPSIVQHSFLFFGELPRRPHAVGAPRRVLESITNFTARYAWANLIEASSVFRVSAGARLCRITPPRNSSGCCHSAGIRPDPGFGITEGREVPNWLCQLGRRTASPRTRLSWLSRQLLVAFPPSTLS